MYVYQRVLCLISSSPPVTTSRDASRNESERSQLWQHEDTVPLVRILTATLERWSFDTWRTVLLLSEHISLSSVLVRSLLLFYDPLDY
jgi:hypothetical protein